MKAFEAFSQFVNKHFKKGEPVTIVKGQIEKFGDKIVMTDENHNLIYEATTKEILQEGERLMHEQMVVHAFMKTLHHVLTKDKHDFSDFEPSMN